MKLKFALYDKSGNLVGYEYHEPNRFGVIQIYHEAVNDSTDLSVFKKHPTEGDIEHNDKNLFLVRQGYYIPHATKTLEESEGLRFGSGYHKLNQRD